ncbi:hypothetical protein EV421DRAFT_1743392 [Armillaria borealis]|uniref:Uncharacterized protein n=1 Tax=Armillaria borealis TaxID=47425 RepID=A0AA39IWS5_9AGAR|nr:hypothetical protein EV421DRAFT_1743392 [Armillaria borealis]
MNITRNITSRTTLALMATIVGITTAITTFLIYRVYWYKIRQYTRRLFLVTPCQPAPRFPTQSFMVPYHYVPRTTGGSLLPPLLPSQSTGLFSLALTKDSSCIHTEQEELDVGEEGRKHLYGEYQEIPVVITAGPLSIPPFSPEFPAHDSITRRARDIAPNCPVIIISDSETISDYVSHSLTNFEYAVWLEDNNLAPHTSDQLPVLLPGPQITEHSAQPHAQTPPIWTLRLLPTPPH